MRKLLLSIAFVLLGASFGVVSADNITNKNKEEIPSRPRSNKRGYFGMIEFSQGFVMSTNGVYRTSLHVINGYRIFPQLSVGLGVGMKIFPGSRPDVLSGLKDDTLHKNKTDITLPLFVHLRTDILKNANVSPYVALNAGYNLSLNKGVFRGYMVEPSVGIGVGVGKKGHQLNIGVGYQMHEVKYHGRIKTIGYGGSVHYKMADVTEMHGAVNVVIGFMW